MKKLSLYERNAEAGLEPAASCAMQAGTPAAPLRFYPRPGTNGLKYMRRQLPGGLLAPAKAYRLSLGFQKEVYLCVARD